MSNNYNKKNCLSIGFIILTNVSMVTLLFFSNNFKNHMGILTKLNVGILLKSTRVKDLSINFLDI